jgi:hypothetical protein
MFLVLNVGYSPNLVTDIISWNAGCCAPPSVLAAIPPSRRKTLYKFCASLVSVNFLVDVLFDRLPIHSLNVRSSLSRTEIMLGPGISALRNNEQMDERDEVCISSFPFILWYWVPARRPQSLLHLYRWGSHTRQPAVSGPSAEVVSFPMLSEDKCIKYCHATQGRDWNKAGTLASSWADLFIFFLALDLNRTRTLFAKGWRFRRDF